MPDRPFSDDEEREIRAVVRLAMVLLGPSQRTELIKRLTPPPGLDTDDGLERALVAAVSERQNARAAEILHELEGLGADDIAVRQCMWALLDRGVLSLTDDRKLAMPSRIVDS